ncbi:MAG: hypothetical protein ACKOSO_09025, partial [Actinomycetota bacterium]
LTVHRLNDEAAAADPRVGDTITLHWAAQNSFVIAGGAAGVNGGSATAHGAPGDDSEREDPNA